MAANGATHEPLRLFCLPYAGGSASVFRSWQKAFPAEVQICPVHLPGRERRFREPIHTEAQPLAALLHRELMPCLDAAPLAPFALFGHSMGGVIAYELARLLTQSGRPPTRLFVSGRRAPRRPSASEMIHALPDDQFVAKLREFEGMPEEVLREPQMMELLLPILRADFQLSETYCYRDGPPLACPVSALGGTRDPRVSRDDLLAWRDETRGEFRLRLFPGGHFFLRQSEQDVLQALADDLFHTGPRKS